ncbi:WSC domain-containing protein [Podospora aff. communis PSN243]|uniref:WSC domain-containing protein n=1 Tax=Podospora aff. communis PSN243 TaxID=3040156 RepID=A0AAV9H6U2_9PEZI|nr:WSC domain-containing protein [Podospora aff. communis PSN243]
MPSLKVLAAAAALAVAGTQATELELPPCLEPFRPFVYSGCFQDLRDPSILQWRTPLDQHSMTEEICMATCKGNGFRYAGLAYYGVCYCGQTVKGPQINDAMCNYPCSGNSSQTCGGDSILSVFTDPTFLPVDDVTIEDYDHIGCWTDDSRLGRALTYDMKIDGSTFTTEKCLAACKNEGYAFAGTEFGGECWCGSVIANDTRAAPDSECNMPCNGDRTQTCGGPGRLSLYVADELKSLEPCGYEPPVVLPSSSAPVVPSAVPSSSTAPSVVPSSSAAPVSSAPPVVSERVSSVPAPVSSEPAAISSEAAPVSSEPAAVSSEPAVSTPPPVVTPPSTPTPTNSVCVSTQTVVPTCEYKCGNWCSKPLPTWTDVSSCKAAYSNCKLQVASCFKSAGWPGSLGCFEFALWCSSLDSYCGSASRGGSKSSYCKSSPPINPNPPKTVTTITTTCAATAAPTTSTKPATTITTATQCPIPSATNICKQPTSKFHNYSPSNPVGGIELPILTCNDLSDEHTRYPFKLYTDPDSRKCKPFGRTQTPSACAAACKEQYEDCTEVYAETCRRGGKGLRPRANLEGRTIWFWDNYWTATTRCKAQYNDCLAENKYVRADRKCIGFATGPW